MLLFKTVDVGRGVPNAQPVEVVYQFNVAPGVILATKSAIVAPPQKLCGLGAVTLEVKLCRVTVTA